jgi:hypothetical protein
VDVGLSDVQDLRIVPRQDFHDRGGESDPVLAGNSDEYLFVCHIIQNYVFLGRNAKKSRRQFACGLFKSCKGMAIPLPSQVER